MKSLIMPALCGLSLLLSVPAQADATKNCHIGSYRLSDGQTFDIAPSDGDTLRWRTFTGETGHLQQIAEVIDPSESLDERIGLKLSVEHHLRIARHSTGIQWMGAQFSVDHSELTPNCQLAQYGVTVLLYEVTSRPPLSPLHETPASLDRCSCVHAKRA
jgi:hypothetical protein